VVARMLSFNVGVPSATSNGLTKAARISSPRDSPTACPTTLRFPAVSPECRRPRHGVGHSRWDAPPFGLAVSSRDGSLYVRTMEWSGC